MDLFLLTIPGKQAGITAPLQSHTSSGTGMQVKLIFFAHSLGIGERNGGELMWVKNIGFVESRSSATVLSDYGVVRITRWTCL